MLVTCMMRWTEPLHCFLHEECNRVARLMETLLLSVKIQQLQDNLYFFLVLASNCSQTV